jgi:phospholipase/lecithinase/hemolysin
MQRRKLHLLAAAFAAAALLAGCGGGGGDADPRVAISRVVVAGDSLADSGTLGFRITVQNAEDPANPFPVFTDIVARNYGLGNLCPAFIATSSTTFAPGALRAGCSNFAISASRIVANSTDDQPDPPEQTVPFQLATAGQAAGTYAATDLVLVDGGGNDSGDLLVAFLGASTPAGQGRYVAFLQQQLPLDVITTTLPQPNGAVQLAILYMRALADTYYNAVKANALDRGATHVAVLDVPDISLTPRVRAALGQVTQQTNAAGGDGAAAAARVQAALRAWTDAFNGELRAQVGTDTRVTVVPFNADFTEEVNNAATFGLSNVTLPACGQVGITSFGDPRPCTSAALDANPPEGLSAGWWKTWAFADGFHPTPFGHQLLAASVNRALARAGWL